MFDKLLPSDRDILFGRAPFQFRVETAPSPHIFKLMANEWRQLLIEEGLHDRTTKDRTAET
jgi:hypothetical protein